MIVPSMTLQEIRKALVADYDNELSGKLKSIGLTLNPFCIFLVIQAYLFQYFLGELKTSRI